MTDEKIIKSCLDGSHQAFAQLVDKYKKYVCSLAYCTTGNFDLSEDIAQDVFLSVWENLSSLKDHGKFKSWLSTVTRNTAINHIKSNTALPQSSDFDIDDIDTSDSWQDPSDALVSREESELVWQALEKLPIEYREALVLYYRHDNSAKQVAELLAITPEAARQRLARGREMIREEVQSRLAATLRKTSPDKKFTASVIAAISGVPIGIALSEAALLGTAATSSLTTPLLSIISTTTAKAVATIAIIAAVITGSIWLSSNDNPTTTDPNSIATHTSRQIKSDNTNWQQESQLNATSDENNKAATSQEELSSSEQTADSKEGLSQNAWQNIDADKFIKTVQNKYMQMETYSADGTMVSDLDLSETLKDMPWISNKVFIDGRQRAVSEFTILLAKPNLYCIEWKQDFFEIGSKREKASWSPDGKDNFFYSLGYKLFGQSCHATLRDSADESAMLTSTVPPLLFEMSFMSILSNLKDAIIDGQDVIDNIDCIIISGNINGYNAKLWIDQNTFLIHEILYIFDGSQASFEISDRQAQEELKFAGVEVTAENIGKLKESRKQKKSIFTKAIGIITQSYTNIIIDKPKEEMKFTPKMDTRGFGDGTGSPESFTTYNVKVNPKGEDMKTLEGKTTEERVISGIIVDINGLPIEGAVADVWSWYRGNEDTTDENGYFKLTKFDPDQETVEITFRKEGFTPRYIIKQPIGVEDARVVLTDDTYFEGTVTGLDGKPVPNVKIRGNNGPKQAEGVHLGDIWTETVTNQNGYYRLYAQADKYEIEAISQQGAVRLAGINLENGQAKRLDIQLEQALTFSAFVIDSQTGEPVEGFRVFNWQSPWIEGISDADGYIEIGGLLPGTLNLNVDGKNHGRWWSQDCVSENNRLILTASDTNWQRNFDNLDFDLKANMEPVTIEVEKPVRITGKVIDPEDNPVAQAIVTLARTGTGNSLTGDTRYSFKTDADGNFEMIIPASKNIQYNLVAHDGKYKQWRKWANGVLMPIMTNPGEVIEDVTISLSKPASIKGIVVDENGQLVANHAVEASAIDKLSNRCYVPEGRTNVNGEFEIKFVREGTYYVECRPFHGEPELAPDGTCRIVSIEEGQTIDGVKLVKRDTDENKRTELKPIADNFKQLLESRITINRELSPDGSKLSIQYAVMLVCQEAKVPFDWQKSATMTDKKCIEHISSVNFKNKPASQAITEIIKEAGLKYDADYEGVYLYKGDK